MKKLTTGLIILAIAFTFNFTPVNAQAAESKLDNVAISTGKMIVGPVANLSPQRVIDKTKTDGISGFIKATIAYVPIIVSKFLEEGSNVITLDQGHQPVTNAGEWMTGAN